MGFTSIVLLVDDIKREFVDKLRVKRLFLGSFVIPIRIISYVISRIKK